MKKCLLKYKMWFSDRVLNKRHTPNGVEICAQGWCCRVQQSNPAWDQRQSCVRKGYRRYCGGRVASMGLSCISAPALVHGLCLSYPAICSLPPKFFADPDPQLALASPWLWSQSPAQLCSPPLGQLGGGPWGEVPRLTCPSAPLPLAQQRCTLTLSSYSEGAASMKRHSQ